MEIQMKKGIVALAVLGAFSGAALAQSSVTLYGILDVNYMWEEKPTTVGTGTATRVQQESVSAINGGHQAGNRWGLRGSEALGGGWNAIFTLESGFDIDRGASAQGGRLFGRQAWVGLSSGMGDLVAGRIASFSSGTGSFDMFGRTDPFGTGFGLASLGQTFYSANALRIDNTIAYRTPVWGGFRGGLGYSTRVDGAEVAPGGNNAKAFISGLQFETGPFWAALTYDSVDFGDTIPNADNQNHLQLGATFDLGPVRLHGGYANQSNVRGVAVGGGSGVFGQLPAGASFDSDSFMLGVTWKIGAFEVLGSYQWLDADSGRVGNVTFEPDYNIWAVGGKYNMSRRTNLYASYASRDADGSLTDNAFNFKQFAVGINHRF
jgi:predicted porin